MWYMDLLYQICSHYKKAIGMSILFKMLILAEKKYKCKECNLNIIILIFGK